MLLGIIIIARCKIIGFCNVSDGTSLYIYRYFIQLPLLYQHLTQSVRDVVRVVIVFSLPVNIAGERYSKYFRAVHNVGRLSTCAGSRLMSACAHRKYVFPKETSASR